MKLYEYIIVFFIFLTVSSGARGQQLRENEVVVIHGEKFVLHQVRTGETIYSIGKQFNVDSLSLVRNNPQISEGLKIGDILKIPYKENIDISEQPV